MKEPQDKMASLLSLDVSVSGPNGNSSHVDIYDYVDGILKNKSPQKSQNNPTW